MTRILTFLPLSPQTRIGHVSKVKSPPPFFPNVKCLAELRHKTSRPSSTALTIHNPFLNVYPASEIVGPGGVPLKSGTPCVISAPRITGLHLHHQMILPLLVQTIVLIHGSTEACDACAPSRLPGHQALLAATAWRNAVATCQYT